MELTPQLLTDEIDFRIAVRGYDRNEVDDFLERVAVAVGQLQDQLAKAVDRARKAEQSVAERRSATAAERQPPQKTVPDEAPTEHVVDTPPVGKNVPVTKTAAGSPVAAEPEVASTPTPEQSEATLTDELRRTLLLAQRTADTAIREARDEAENIRREAQVQADQAREESEDELRKARDDARRRLVDEITELEGVRESLRGDTGVLERYLGDERARVRETIQVLRRLVDDPQSFQVQSEPALSGVVVPEDVRALPASPTAAEPVAVPELETGSDRPLPHRPLPDPSVEGVDAPGAPSAVTPTVADEEHSESRAAEEPSTRSAATDTAIAPSQTLPPKAPREEAHLTAERVEEPTPLQESTGSLPDEAKLDLGLEPHGNAAPNPLAGEPDGDLAHLFDTGEHTTFDWRTPTEGRSDQGPHTQPVAAARFEEEPDDAFLAELRRAMHDNEPLGPDGSAKG